MKIFNLLFSVLLLFSIVEGIAQNPKANLESKINKIVERETVVGLGVAIVHGNEIVYKNGFGYADRENKTPYTTKTVQPIASISKTLIGVSLMKAQEMGLLNLDDPINKYLPFEIKNPRYKDQVITIRHLATHTSSLKDTKHYEKAYIFDGTVPPIYKKINFGLKRMMVKKYIKGYNKNEEIPLEQFLKNIYTKKGKWYKKKNFSKEEPGMKYRYSNNGSALASMILGKATGMPYKEFVETHILKPLEMEHSGWSLKDYKADQKASLYVLGQKIPEFELITIADGGFITCIDDFSRYFHTMIKGYTEGNQILSHASMTEMIDASKYPGKEYAIYWSTINGNLIGHTGGDPGVSTYALFNKKSLNAYIFFLNVSDNKDHDEVVNSLFRVASEYCVEIKEEKD